jgi:hypothetical protein
MKQLYRYYPDFDADDNLVWYVHELMTDQIVAEYFFEEDAAALCLFLERGGAFAGHTPSFMMVKVPTDINAAFAAEFAE